MGKVAIVTDSTAYLPQEIIDQYSIHVVPLFVNWDGETFLDGVDIMPKEFYERLQKSANLPTTSQPPVGAFEVMFQKLHAQGYDIISILISSGISGTVTSAIQAKELLPEANIEVIDSQTAAMAAGLHVFAVAQAAAEGASLEECKAIAQKAQTHTDVVFAVDTLEFLHRGGRIGGAKRFLGSMLNIKPILEMRGGKIEAVEQVRTQRKALNHLICLTKERMSKNPPAQLAVFHSNVPDIAQSFLGKVEGEIDTQNSFIAELSPVIGTHVGPGTIGLACMSGMAD